MKNEWKRIIAFNDKYFPDWRENFELIFCSNALAGEVGEICNKVKKLYGGGTNHNKDTIIPYDLLEECVDVFIYMVLLYEQAGGGTDWESFQYVFNLKMLELEKRMTVGVEQ